MLKRFSYTPPGQNISWFDNYVWEHEKYIRKKAPDDRIFNLTSGIRKVMEAHDVLFGG
jgi:hypothetical protein